MGSLKAIRDGTMFWVCRAGSDKLTEKCKTARRTRATCSGATLQHARGEQQLVVLSCASNVLGAFANGQCGKLGFVALDELGDSVL